MGYNMSRYTRAIHVGSRIATGQPLSNEELQAAVPSIFATEAHESRSARFAPVPTVTVLDGLRAEGFEPFSAVQARTRVEGKTELHKIGVNVNQIALAANRGRTDLLQHQWAEINELRRVLPEARGFLKAAMDEQRRKGVRLYEKFAEQDHV
ncbi:plasmid mobilization relaxosome protein MobC [Paracoccus sulfuroxidans]|uniref:Mobilization protein MobC n=1 Tax=Paracoccus sulfuroxidans TaxID=384678 RepID=A0A562N7Z5_9RHOB|nr:plasmid mobilization relaxosome protein MobC [Paracoccus sulfuroxidans]TWI28220.1 mobilization protein MobC [Paracoccus sulfuroxidans]